MIMNKIQYIKLLAMRGITELNGISIAKAVEKSGGDPSEKEMVIVNEESMKYFAEKWNEANLQNKELKKKIAKLEERDFWLSCLEQAGVDNWEGCSFAIDIKNGND